jgi:hypothetical protein
VDFLFVVMLLFSLSCWSVSIWTDGVDVVMFGKNRLMSSMLLAVLRFLASVVIRCDALVRSFRVGTGGKGQASSISLAWVLSLGTSCVARVNGGVASGLGGALVLFGGCGSNIVPFLTHIARRAEGVWDMQC